MKRTIILLVTAAALTGCGQDGRWTIHKDGTATDNTTGLTWQRCFTHQKFNKDTDSCDYIDLKKVDFAKSPKSNAGDSVDTWIIPDLTQLATIRECNVEDKSNPLPIQFTKTGDDDTDRLQVDIAMAPCMNSADTQPQVKIPDDIFPGANSAELIISDNLGTGLSPKIGLLGYTFFNFMVKKVNDYYRPYDFTNQADREFGGYLGANYFKLRGINDLKRENFPLDRAGILLVKQSQSYLQSEAHAMSKYMKEIKYKFGRINRSVNAQDTSALVAHKKEITQRMANAVEKHCSAETSKPSFCTPAVRPQP